MWQRVVQHCRRKPAGERQRASRRTQRGSLTLATLAVWCRSWLILSPTWRRWEAFCGNGQPATASGVAMYIAGSGSPHVADAQVGEIRGYARLPPPPGWRKCPSLVICLCLAEMERFVVADSLPPPPGWRFLCASRRPGMSPTPRSAKYPATHGCHHLRGGGNVRLSSSSSSPPRRRWGGRYAAHMALA